ncbi:ribosomal protein S14, mitochondrial [Raphanus sativus]|uniref:Small ribosomal subunit protein uS14m n=1 Tax=Raphanus sativus TaxID=3726 RepID=A0A6J0JGF4_RAPSA|nr:ribosomal protein S14, mitochondrial [Raphanus sativus]
MSNLRGVLTNVSSYCQRSFSQSVLLWRRSVVNPTPNNNIAQTQHRHISTTLTKPASSKHSGTEQGVKRNSADHRRRLLAARFELRRKLYKAFCKDPELPSEMREKNRYKLSKLPRNSAFTRIRNRCVFTGRSRSVTELFRMSRICFRGLANKGELMGIKKSSW